MRFKNVLITGGAGFVGSNLAIKLKAEYPGLSVTCMDNLKRRGSELTLPRLRAANVNFMHGDIRNKEDFADAEVDLVLECSAEPSVMAGINSAPDYLINTNLLGTINCLEFTRDQKASLVFLSTSRVYPIEYINSLKYEEQDTRFELSENQAVPGASPSGIAEDFPLDKPRSLYGATKLASELLIQEYADTYGMPAIIDRFGVITGPWQMGKVDQGVFVLWVARHYFNQPLSYIGFGGQGKQVRDFIHIDDVYRAVKIQLENFEVYRNGIWNIGGGADNSVSLQELTKICQVVTGNTVPIESVSEDRPADVKLFITNSSKFLEKSGLKWQKDAEATVKDIYDWIKQNEAALKPILA